MHVQIHKHNRLYTYHDIIWYDSMLFSLSKITFWVVRFGGGLNSATGMYWIPLTNRLATDRVTLQQICTALWFNDQINFDSYFQYKMFTIFTTSHAPRTKLPKRRDKIMNEDDHLIAPYSNLRHSTGLYCKSPNHPLPHLGSLPMLWLRRPHL